jgi:hypothetical protein
MITQAFWRSGREGLRQDSASSAESSLGSKANRHSVTSEHFTTKNRSSLASNGAFQTALAFTIFAFLSFVFFGWPIITRLSTVYIGGGIDSICHVWAIAWWPYAVTHLRNPIIAHNLWAPIGYNLAWAAAIPGPSLLIYPVTKYFGPVVSYNILCLIAPPAAAVSAFVLCRYISGRFWPAAVGGYIFGFSPYILSHLLAHLFLIIVFPVPLAVYVTLLRIDGKIARGTFITSLIAILLFQFLSSTEIFATATVFGAMAIMLGFAVIDKEARSNLVSVTKEIACVYGGLTIAISPYLYYVFADGLPTPPNPAAFFSNDLLTFVLSPPVLLIAPHLGDSQVGRFFETAPWWEQAGYLGPGLWIVTSLFNWSYWRTRLAKFLILSFAFIAIMSLGPQLHSCGEPLVPMPWRLVNALPLIDEALPGRFGMYLFLVVGVAAASYLADVSISVSWRILLACISILFIMPDLAIWRQVGRAPAFLRTSAESVIYVPSFFRSSEYKRYLTRGDNVLILPLGGGSNFGLLWQAQSKFYFNNIGWYGSIPPPDSERWPIMAALHGGTSIPNFSEQLNAFLGAHQVKAIIVDSSNAGPWPGMLSEAGMSGVSAGGVLFYRVPAHLLVSFRDTTVHEMAEKQAAYLFAALVVAASKYVERGFPLQKLAPGELKRLKLLNFADLSPTGDSRWWQNLWLGSSGGMVGVGIIGNYQDLKLLINNYGPDAARIFFPYPKKLSQRRKVRDGHLLITFTLDGLKRAAQKANSSGAV